MAETGSQMNLNTEPHRGLQFSCLRLEEQTAIAAVLSDMDTELAALEQRRDQDPRPQARHDAGTTHRKNAARYRRLPCLNNPAPNAGRRTVSLRCSPTSAARLPRLPLPRRVEQAREQPLHRRRAAARKPASSAAIPTRTSPPPCKSCETAADTTGITLYQANLRTYQLLRYGVHGADRRRAAARDGASGGLGAPGEERLRPGRGGDACAAATSAGRTWFST